MKLLCPYHVSSSGFTFSLGFFVIIVYFCFVLFEAGFGCVAQARLKLMILLP
jgi:hypothetical protein